jgi:NAD/NADP transhydrogenase alpha subunit
MIAGVLKETVPGERRVAVVPSAFPLLAKAGVEVVIERGAGAAAGFPDGAFKDKGARIASSRSEVLEAARVLLQVRPLASAAGAPSGGLEGMGRDHVLVGLLDPLGTPAGIQTVAARGITAFALELIPRITRAQAMDVLSSSATITGYKAVLLAASTLPQMFPMLMTAGGTLAPARVLVIGAGVAGLQAIATAKRLGAVVQAYDVRPAVKEQVESLGAKFVELPLEAADAQDQGGYARPMDESFYRRQRETMLKRSGDHHRRRAGQEGAHPPHRGNGGRNATGRGHRGRRRGAGRQLRADASRGDGDPGGGEHPRAPEPPLDGAPAREPAVRPQHGDLPGPDRGRGRAEDRPRRRDRPGDAGHPRWGSRPPARPRGTRPPGPRRGRAVAAVARRWHGNRFRLREGRLRVHGEAV